MISSNIKTDSHFIESVAKFGYTRVPVYNSKDKNDILGVIVTKNLLKLDYQPDKTIL